MNILAINCGSSSVKYAAYSLPKNIRIFHGLVQRIGLKGGLLEFETSNKNRTKKEFDCPDHDSALYAVIEQTRGQNIPIHAVSHRVVFGGEEQIAPVIIDDKVLKNIDENSVFAPLHNPVNLMGIKAAQKHLPEAINIACFDTMFFRTLPPHVYTYGLPYEWYEKYRIRKYGFHGLSHSYALQNIALLLSKKANRINVITVHMGNGTSITAIKNGKAYEHSMGFTPLEGAIMGTRCGDIDPSIPLYVMKKENLSKEEMGYILNNRSGILGISGYMDHRELLQAMDSGDSKAKLAFDMECHRITKYIGAYAAILGRVDAVVFTGGVGENSRRHIKKICSGLHIFGLNLSDRTSVNYSHENKDRVISKRNSRVLAAIIRTDEESILAREAYNLLMVKRL